MKLDLTVHALRRRGRYLPGAGPHIGSRTTMGDDRQPAPARSFDDDGDVAVRTRGLGRSFGAIGAVVDVNSRAQETCDRAPLYALEGVWWSAISQGMFHRELTDGVARIDSFHCST